MTTSRHLGRQAAAAAALVLAIAAVAGCGDDDEPATAGQAEATTTTDGPSPDTVEITAFDYRFEGLPAEVDAGSTLALRNESTGELHELVAMRLPDGETRSADELVALPAENFQALFAGPPATVIVAPPGEDGFTALGAGTVPEPGRYLFVCFIPTGADPDAYLAALAASPGEPPQIPGGPPHVAAGMYQEVTVR